MKFNRLATTSIAVLAISAAACVPDPLEGFDDAGLPTNNPNAMTGDTGMTPDMGGGGGTFNAEYVAVAAIMKQNCLAGGCHGNPAAVSDPFVVNTGPLATEAELQTILSSVIPAVSGLRLVAPGNPNMSEIYIRVSKPAGDTQLMGAGQYGATATPLAADQISAIQTWIMNGANYTQ